MKLAAISFMLLVAACGGKSRAPSAPGNTGGGAPTKNGVPALWAEVFVEGAAFTLDNTMPGAPQEGGPTVVTATVTRIEHAGEVAIATLNWEDSDGDEMPGLPTAIKVSPAGVWFGSDGFDGAPTFPSGATTTERDGYVNYATPSDNGTVCYGEGPATDAGDCADVCFAELCVAPGAGIVSGGGTWWPNYEPFSVVKK